MNGGVNKLGQRGGVNATFVDGLAATAGDTFWTYDALGQFTSANAPVAAADRAYSFDTISHLLQSRTDTATSNQNSNQMRNHHQPPNKLVQEIPRLTPFFLCFFLLTACVSGGDIEVEPAFQQFVARFTVGQSRGEVVANERHEDALSAIIHAPDSADMSPEDVFQVAFMAKDRLHQTTKANTVEVLFSCNRPKLRKYLSDFFMERLKPTEQLTDQKEINRLLGELYDKCGIFATLKKKAEADGWMVTPVNDGLKLKRGLKDGLMILDPLLGVRFSRKN